MLVEEPNGQDHAIRSRQQEKELLRKGYQLLVLMLVVRVVLLRDYFEHNPAVNAVLIKRTNIAHYIIKMEEQRIEGDPKRAEFYRTLSLFIKIRNL